MPEYPKVITGGCLCDGVRYRIEFAPDHDWKRGPHTCQCTQCRKNSGCLVYHLHSVSPSELTWLSKSTYAEYNSSPNCYRGFCDTCGSNLFWTKRGVEESKVEVEMAVGTFDEQFLVGDKNYGKVLANPEGDHFYLKSEIRGVTEEISRLGARFWEGSEDGPLNGNQTVLGDDIALG